MNGILLRDDLSEMYYISKNVDELFDSDILILPKIRHWQGNLFSKMLSLGIKKEDPNIKVKYYYKFKDSLPEPIIGMEPQALELGSIVISTLAGLVTICEFILKYYKRDKYIISATLYIKNGNNSFVAVQCKGDSSDLMAKIKESLNENKIDLYEPIFKNSRLDDPDILRKYKQLFDDGIITQEEFQAKKKEILDL